MTRRAYDRTRWDRLQACALTVGIALSGTVAAGVALLLPAAVAIGLFR